MSFSRNDNETKEKFLSSSRTGLIVIYERHVAEAAAHRRKLTPAERCARGRVYIRAMTFTAVIMDNGRGGERERERGF